MNSVKRKKLEAAGWKIGSAGDFLGLSSEEAQVVEMKLALSESLRRRRAKKHLTQDELAKLLKSSQSRVAKLEAGAPGVSLELLFRALFAMGATAADIARDLRPRRRSAA
ncbi:MAG: helix-turn-helix transcriptional regulator [Candidatus Eisenbacteria bacterium]